MTITVLRNAVPFIPGVILLNRFWQLDGVIAVQPPGSFLAVVSFLLLF